MDKTCFLLLLACLTLPGCLATTSNGQITELNTQDLSDYNNLTVNPIGPPKVTITYPAPMTCSYQTNRVVLSRPPETGTDQVSIYPLGQKLRVVVKHTRTDTPATVTVSQYLITPYGQVLDYNAVDEILSNTARIDPQNEAANTAALMAMGQKTAPLFSHAAVVQDFNIMVPEYTTTQFVIGADTGIIRMTDGNIWGVYVTRGTVIYNGRNVVEMDLLRHPPDASTATGNLVGYALVDPTNLMPVFSELDAGSHESFEQISCSSS